MHSTIGRQEADVSRVWCFMFVRLHLHLHLLMNDAVLTQKLELQCTLFLRGACMVSSSADVEMPPLLPEPSTVRDIAISPTARLLHYAGSCEAAALMELAELDIRVAFVSITHSLFIAETWAAQHMSASHLIYRRMSDRHISHLPPSRYPVEIEIPLIFQDTSIVLPSFFFLHSSCPSQ